MARLLETYRNDVVAKLMEEFGYSSAMEVPRLEKIVINAGLGEASRDIKILDAATRELALIAGQRSVVTRSRKAIANFKIRQGVPIGCMVTLRRKRMYEFFDRLVNIVIPRIRDFKGLPVKSFDGSGNYTLGIQDNTIFPEIDIDKVQNVWGMNITICTSAGSPREGESLLRHLGMPLVKAEEEGSMGARS